jgi:hypothetical protein
MTTRETAIAKLQQLPEPLLKQVSDFIDRLLRSQKPDSTNDNHQDDLTHRWEKWFESIEHLERVQAEPASDYQQLLLAKYREQGLEL